METELNKEIVEALQKLALNGVPLIELAKYVIKAKDSGRNSSLYLIAYFRKAFSLKIREVAIISTWEFLEGGFNTFDKIEEEIYPLIEKWKREILQE